MTRIKPSPITTYTPVQAVFPATPPSLEVFSGLLRGLSRTETLFACAELNLILSNPSYTDEHGKQQYAVSRFLDAAEVSRLNQYLVQQGNAAAVLVFHRGQLLELIRWACLVCDDAPDDGATFEDPEVRRSFAQTALIASDLWRRRVYDGRLSLDGGLEASRQRAMGAFRQAAMAGSSGLPPMDALARGYEILCEHMPGCLPGLDSAFRAQTNLDVDEYLACMCLLATHCLERSPETAAEQPGCFRPDGLKDATSQGQQIFARFMELEAQSPDDLHGALWGERTPEAEAEAGPFDYNALRRRPILRADDGRAIILDPVFFAEKAVVGPLFHLLGVPGSDANRLFGAFGEAFERYACRILGRMCPSGSEQLAKRLVVDLRGRTARGETVQLADACLNDVTECVLFEMKAAWVRDEFVMDSDYSRFLQHLREKYGVSQEGGAGRRVKGVGQLARTIRNLANGDWVCGEDLTLVRIIYPLLVVYDPLIDTPLYGQFLADEFREALQPDQVMGNGDLVKGRFTVKPLITITVDDLEKLEDSVQHFGFRNLLRDYSEDCTDRIRPLRDFIAASDYGERIYRSRDVVERGVRVMERTRTLFLKHGGSG